MTGEGLGREGRWPVNGVLRESSSKEERDDEMHCDDASCSGVVAFKLVCHFQIWQQGQVPCEG